MAGCPACGRSTTLSAGPGWPGGTGWRPGTARPTWSRRRRSLVALHGTDPATVYLSAWARVDGMTVGDIERALYDDRSLVKHLAMRRTLFVFPREALGDAQAGASARVAAGERRGSSATSRRRGCSRTASAGSTEPPRRSLAALAGGREATSSELREEIPLLEGSIVYGEGKSWGGQCRSGRGC